MGQESVSSNAFHYPLLSVRRINFQTWPTQAVRCAVSVCVIILQRNACGKILADMPHIFAHICHYLLGHVCDDSGCDTHFTLCEKWQMSRLSITAQIYQSCEMRSADLPTLALLLTLERANTLVMQYQYVRFLWNCKTYCPKQAPRLLDV